MLACAEPKIPNCIMSRTAEYPGNATFPACTCMRPSSAQRCSVGNTLPGLSRPLRVEGAFEPLLLVEVDLGEHRRHQVALLDADAVLAGQHAADLDAELQDVGAELPRRAPARPACWRRRGSADADCRRRRGRRWRRAARSARDSSRMRLQHLRQLARAGWCRPCSSSRARCGRPPGTPPCGRPRTAAARPPSSTRGSVVDAAFARRSPRRARSGGRPRPPGRRARRSAAPRRRADSRRGRTPRPRGSPAGPSSPCRPG